MMNIISACRAIQQARGNALLVATMGAMGAFDAVAAQQPRVSSVPLMGGAPGIGLGLALSCPDKKVVVVDGDASLLMQLGNLVTVATQRPANLYHFVVCNGTQFTGMSNLPVPGGGHVDFCAMAKAAGYTDAQSFDDADELAKALPAILDGIGPRFIALQVDPNPPTFSATTPQQDWKDWHFHRMHREARDLIAWIAESRLDEKV